MKYWACIAGILFLFGLMPVRASGGVENIPTGLSATTVNMLTNSSFEDGDYATNSAPTGWEREIFNPAGSLIWDDSQAHIGSKSVLITSDVPNDASWTQTVAVQPDTDYLVSGWIKTENVTHSTQSVNVGANLSLFGTWTHSAGLVGTHDWTQIGFSFNSGGNTEVTIAARLGYWSGTTTGSAWFDDLQMRPLVPEDYKVRPILFVPNDHSPNPFGLKYIDRQMQLVQRWYGEQLRDRTFTFEPAQIVIGENPTDYYFGDCYPPDYPACWGREMWDYVFQELGYSGYSAQNHEILGVFFQGEGLGTALGGGKSFLVDIHVETTFGDCFDPGCGRSVATGGLAHELGHALGLPHTADDANGSPGKSVMNYGFYNYRKATFVNTGENPERDVLYASPFLHKMLRLMDGGFETCLSNWTLVNGTESCTATSQRSGLSALRRLPVDNLYHVEQDVIVSAGETYDISGWVNIESQSGNFDFKIQVQALSAGEDVLETFILDDFTDTTRDWERFARSLTMPAGTETARVQILSQGAGVTATIDEIDMQLSPQMLPVPLPMFHHNGDAVPTLQPLLQWSEIAASTAYRLQVAEDSNFQSLIIDTTVASPFYPVPAALAYDSYYYWRVKAINGFGESNWSVTWSFVPRRVDDYYNDEYENDDIEDGWTWVREDSSYWRIGGPAQRRSDGYLVINTQSGDLPDNNNARNLLLRDAPPGDFEVSTQVDFWPPLSQNFHQAGLLIYKDDDNYIKLFHIYDDGYKLEWFAEVDGVPIRQDAIYHLDPMPLKIVRIGNTYQGYYSSDGYNWTRLGDSISLAWPDARIGLGAYHANATDGVSATFNWFRVRQPCYGLDVYASPSSGGTFIIDHAHCADGAYRGSTTVQIEADPNPGWNFTGWLGDISGDDNPTSVAMVGSRVVTGTFAINQAPILSAIGNKTGYLGRMLTFSVSATDLDGPPPSLAAENLPSGATFTDLGDGSGLFEWVPALTDADSTVVTFVASDGDKDASEAVTIWIEENLIFLSVVTSDG